MLGNHPEGGHVPVSSGYEGTPQLGSHLRPPARKSEVRQDTGVKIDCHRPGVAQRL